MRFLRILGLARIIPRLFGHIFRAETLGDSVSGGIDRFGSNLHTIGTHIGYETGCFAANVHAFIKALRHLHGARSRKAQLPRRGLLQGGGGEWRARIALGRLCLDGNSLEVRAFQHGADGTGLFAVLDIELSKLLAIKRGEAGSETVIARCLEKGCDIPVFLADKAFDFRFAVADQTQRYRLHATGRAGAGKLAPEHRRKGEADQIIECTAGEIGVHQRLINIAWMGNCIQNGLLVMALKATRFTVLPLSAFFCRSTSSTCQEMASPSRSGSVARMRPSLSFSAFYNIRQALGGIAVHFPGHCKIFVRAHRAILGWQVPHMAKGGQNLIVRAQIFVDGFGLGRRFDDDDVHVKQPKFASHGGPKPPCRMK